ncbi:MAG: universal stress protein [Chlorobium sp.]|jgi:nucleotide-binding universal stress UspA family protein|uniref:universal stress protein n=1 Tax=Chlorobium sp. TaxID=1095 RepID=UPI001DA5F318|nr:universal stress protein [Chlorobium sp.]MBN1279057.1 universal stress protein [Chlorobiaceae bacterium]MCF8216830.1 universal stress protein [Chlorobium sp.]MCF8271675.1 universal stress protein [Chlorobium sp.]MCF8288047.1 universal stress protein [Chlorobium sp.]MCF8291631.1 universal stress protein [Chlorobium sp.]
MSKVIACVDGSAAAGAVCDAAAWSASQLEAPLVLMHVLEKTETPVKGDLSGNIGLGTREQLLEDLVELEAKKSRLALEHGKEMLQQARLRTSKLYEGETTTLQRHGNLLETTLELQHESRLLVMGRQGEAHENASGSIGSHIENVVRAMHRPILVVMPSFTPPKRFMIAYDASDTAEKALDMVAQSPLLKGLDCHVVMIGSTSKPEPRNRLEAACRKLEQQEFVVTRSLLEGEVIPTLRNYQEAHGIELMVMGAYGHSKIRRFLVGSNTTRMVASSRIPLLLLR